MKIRFSYKFARNILLIATILQMFSCQPEILREAIQEEIRPDEMSDLVAKAITTTQTYPKPDEQIEITLKLQNRAGTSEKNVLVVLYAGNNLIDSSRIDLASYSDTTIKFPWNVPQQAGLITLTTIIDPMHELIEEERDDNSISIDIVVSPKPAMETDLAVTRFEMLSQENQPVFARIGIRNKGTVAAEVPLVLRSDGKVVRMRLVGPLLSRSEIDVSMPWPRKTTPETRSAEVNPRYRDEEKNSKDNYFEINPRPSVDLKVEGLSVFAAQVEQGRSRNITIGFRIVNTGQTVIHTPFRSSILPGTFTKMRSDTQYVITRELASGQVAYVSHNISLPENVHEFDIRVELDVDKTVEESNESNNISLLHFKNPSPDVGRWVSIGPRRITGSTQHNYGWNDAVGRLSAIAIHPTNPSIIYVGARGSGLWKTTNGGSSWYPISDMVTTNIAAIAIDPTQHSRIYLVTKHEGIFKTEDAGLSWLPISTADLNAVVHGGKLLINPDSPNLLYLASGSGLYRSSDSGINWQLVKSGGSVTGLVMSPADPTELYVAIYHESSDNIAGVFRTLDGGSTWHSVSGCPRGTLPAIDKNTTIRLAVSGSVLYAGYRGSTGFQLYRSADSCQTRSGIEIYWERGWNPTGQVGGEDIFRTLWSGMWTDPINPQYIYLGGTYFWRSTDGGDNFSRTSGLSSPANSAHVDHHAFAADPLSSNIIYTLNDGGIYRSTNRGATGTWTFVGDGIANVEFYDHACAVTDAGLVIGGTQDNGIVKYDGSSTVWKMIRGGDGATVDIDPTDAQILYSMGQYAASIARSKNGGPFISLANNLPTGSSCFNLHYQVHTGIPSTLLASCNALWRTTTSEPPGDWEEIFVPPTGQILRSEVDATVDLYYAGSSDGHLYAGSGGSDFQSVFVHPLARGVTDIEINPHRPEIVYATYGGTGIGRVFELKRSSATPTSMTAVDITSDLPIGLAVKTIAIDRLKALTLYVGTPKGVFRGRSSDEGTTWYWRPYNNGMPLVDVRDLEVHPKTGVLRAATFGRSVFEVNTDIPIGSIIAVEGKITLLRVHDLATLYGPPTDQIDVEVVIWLDSQPGKAFGFQLRNTDEEATHQGMLDILRSAFNHDHRVRIEYVRTGFQNGLIIRVVRIP